MKIVLILSIIFLVLILCSKKESFPKKFLRGVKKIFNQTTSDGRADTAGMVADGTVEIANSIADGWKIFQRKVDAFLDKMKYDYNFIESVKFGPTTVTSAAISIYSGGATTTGDVKSLTWRQSIKSGAKKFAIITLAKCIIYLTIKQIISNDTDIKKQLNKFKFNKPNFKSLASMNRFLKTLSNYARIIEIATGYFINLILANTLKIDDNVIYFMTHIIATIFFEAKGVDIGLINFTIDFVYGYFYMMVATGDIPNKAKESIHKLTEIVYKFNTRNSESKVDKDFLKYVDEEGDIIKTLINFIKYETPKLNQGYTINHINPFAYYGYYTRGATKEQCRFYSLWFGYPAFGYRNEKHPDEQWRNTCFFYDKIDYNFKPNPKDDAHDMNCAYDLNKIYPYCY